MLIIRWLVLIEEEMEKNEVCKVCPHWVLLGVSSLGAVGCVLTGCCWVCPHWVLLGVSSLGAVGCVLTGCCWVCPHWVLLGVSSLGAVGCVLTAAYPLISILNA